VDASINTSPAVGDLDNDGTVEIVFGANRNVNATFCLNHNGLQEWNYTVPSGGSNSAPIIADLDSDGMLEVLCGSDYDNALICLNHNGELEWNRTTGFWRMSPAVADLNNDGFLEILFDDNLNKIFCLNATGQELWNYTKYGVAESNSIAIADLNSDADLEIITIGGCGLYVLSSYGIEMFYYLTDFLNGWIFDTTPLIADLDGDGIVEIIVEARRGPVEFSLQCFSLNNVVKSGRTVWSTIQGSAFHTGQMDSDGDFIDDFTENFYTTNKSNSDSDNDQLGDWNEIYIYQTNPLNEDSDTDGLTDFEELKIYSTDPNEEDTDGDTINDFEEIITYNTNPNNIDSDSDTLNDADEINIYETNPNDKDSDQDGYTDNLEISEGTDPNDPMDFPEIIITPPPETIIVTPPPEIITTNQTFTITNETGVLVISLVCTTTFGFTVVFALKKKRQRNNN
ncbi:MAG: FG-GAP-like repeat-containing protein, partial [Candidatus Thorarchaeota archaeon]